MLIIVEGYQNIGKTYLLNRSPYKHLIYKYLFPKYARLKLFKNNKALFGMSIGKDLDILQFHLEHPEINTILDRSFLSSMIYRRILRKVKKKYVDEYFLFVEKILEKFKDENLKIIQISSNGKRILSRTRNDGFDKAIKKADIQEEMYNSFIKKLKSNPLISKKVMVFKNHYDQDTVVRFNKLLTKIMINGKDKAVQEKFDKILGDIIEHE